VTLSLVAQLCAILMRDAANAELEKKALERKSSQNRLQAFKIGRGLRVS